MLDRIACLKKVAAADVAIWPIIVALLLVPAAVIVSLYPLNWILGGVNFHTASILLWPVRLLLIAPVVLGLLFARWRKDWVLAAMVVPGIALVLVGPDRIGAQQPNRMESKAFYPEHYIQADVAARVKEVERAISNAGWLLVVSPTQSPSIEKLRSFQSAADASVTGWRGGVSAGAELQTKLDQANARKTAMGSHAPMRDMSFIGNIRMKMPDPNWLRQRSDVDAEISNLTAQINKLNAGAAANNLYPAAVSATAALKVELEAVERQVAESISFAKALPYIVAASISFAIFMFLVDFMHVAFGTLVLMTGLACLWSALPWSLDDWLPEITLILYPAIICALSAFVLRFTYRGFLDNVQAMIEFERKHLALSALRAVIAWLPFPIVVAAVVLFNAVLYSYASSAVYCEGSAKPFCGSLTSEPPIQNSDPSRDTLRDDINAAIHRLLAKFEAEAIRSAEGARSNVAAQVNAAQQQVMAKFDEILPGNLYQIFPELKPPRCGWFLPNPMCFARKIALERLNAAYQAPRNRYRARLAQALADVGARITQGTVNAATGFQDAIKGQSQQAALHATKTVDATFVVLGVLSALQMVFMLIVSMRALLLIFGRMLYRGDPATTKPRRGASGQLPYLALSHSENKSDGNGRLAVRSYKGEFELAGDKYLPLLTKRSHNVDDADQATLLSTAFRVNWPIRRLMNGCLILTEVTRLAEKKSIRFSTADNRQLIVWTIPAGAEVFFRWNRFVAATASMQIKKTVSLRIGGLATGTTMQASVVGPGLLIQESNGSVELTHQEDIPGSVLPSRVLSWETGSRFRIKSPKRLTSVYFDPPSLDVERGAQAVSDAGKGSIGLGLATELFRLVRP